jgi:hypothetical protein
MSSLQSDFDNFKKLHGIEMIRLEALSKTKNSHNPWEFEI